MSTITFEIHIPELDAVAKALEALIKTAPKPCQIEETGLGLCAPEPDHVQFTPVDTAEEIPFAVEEPPKKASISMDMITQKAIKLVEAGRTADLQQILMSYGVVGLPQLPQEAYEAFYTALEAMG